VELLCGLAEECGELTQAALKLRRAYDKTNPTPMDEDTAFERLCEEVADVSLYIEQLPLPRVYIQQIKDKKLDRWHSRLMKREEEQCRN
jgi:hypothetical protein